MRTVTVEDIQRKSKHKYFIQNTKHGCLTLGHKINKGKVLRNYYPLVLSVLLYPELDDFTYGRIRWSKF